MADDDWSDASLPQTRQAWATRYLAAGFACFVLGEAKRPLPNCPQCRDAGPAEHPPALCGHPTCHGFHAATRQLDALLTVLDQHPTSELAIRTGAASGLVVIDAEGHADTPGGPTGVQVLDDFETWTTGRTLPATLTALTPSGGVHLYYRLPPGVSVRGRQRILPGVDVKAEGGYVVAPSGVEERRRWLRSGAESLPTELSPELLTWVNAGRPVSGETGAGVGEHSTGYDFRAFDRDGCPGGYRDEFFNDLAFRLRKLDTPIEEALTRVREAWERAGQPPAARWYMPLDDAVAKLRRVYATVTPDPTLADWNGGGGGGAITRTRDGAAPPPEHLTDAGNAARLVRLHGTGLRFVPELRTWMRWHGHRWVRDVGNDALHLTLDVPTDLRRAAEAADGDQADAVARWALASESTRARRAMLEAASADPRIRLHVADMDASPDLLVVGNGVLDLVTGVLREGRHDDNATRAAAVDFNPDAACPLWERHIELITQRDPVLAAYLRRAAGYSLTGHVHEQCFFLLEGDGNNGKNAFVEPLKDLLGEYAQVGTSALLTGGDEQHPTILADLVGARLVFVDEARQGRPLNAERIKALTGTRQVKARLMRGDFFTFDARLKLWIAGNNHPSMQDPTDGLWRRLHRIVFQAEVPKEQRVRDYARHLYEQEASGILNWALGGLAEWRELGSLGAPAAVEAAVAEVRAEEDSVGLFLAERCTDDPDARTTTAELYQEFLLWYALAGLRVIDRPSKISFGRQLKRRFTPYIARDGGYVARGYEGLRVLRHGDAV